LNPSDALDNLIWYAHFHSGRHSKSRQGVPGEIVALQSQDTRRSLEQLTTKDASNVRDETIKLMVESPALWQRIARRR
jgi:hypothetical protein